MSNDRKPASPRPELVRVRNRINQRQTTLSFPTVPFPHGFQMIFKQYDYSTFLVPVNGRNPGLNPLLSTDRRNTAVDTSSSSIELPFPRTLIDDNKLKVSEFERSFMAERLAATLSQQRGGLLDVASGAVSRISNAIENMGQRVGESISKGQVGADVARIVQQAMNVDFSQATALSNYLIRSFAPQILGNFGEDISKAVNLATGTAINPNETLSFEGVNLKSFSVSWDLFPSDETDSQQIRKIIREIKKQSLPTTSSEGLTIQGAERLFLKYPSVVIINLLGVDETHWMRFKPCMITGVNVSYGAGGDIAILQGGRPSAVTLSIDFMEMNIHTRDDYSDTDPADTAVNKSETPPTGQSPRRVGPQ